MFGSPIQLQLCYNWSLCSNSAISHPTQPESAIRVSIVRTRIGLLIWLLRNNWLSKSGERGDTRPRKIVLSSRTILVDEHKTAKFYTFYLILTFSVLKKYIYIYIYIYIYFTFLSIIFCYCNFPPQNKLILESLILDISKQCKPVFDQWKNLPQPLHCQSRLFQKLQT